MQEQGRPHEIAAKSFRRSLRLSLSLALLSFVIVRPFTLVEGADIQTILKETQRVTKEGQHISMVWWIPQLYWEESFRDSAQMTEESRAQVLRLLAAYNVMAVVDADFDVLGAIHSRPEADIASHCRLSLNEIEVVRIPESDLPDAMRNLLGVLRPVLQNVAGSFGKAMQLYVYRSKTEKTGQPWEKSKGELTFSLQNKSYRWRLPLACTLPNKRDPKTGDEFPGDYKFNPYTGAPLP